MSHNRTETVQKRVDRHGRQFNWVQTRYTNYILKSGETLDAVEDYGVGTLEMYEFHVDSRHMQFIIELYTDNGTKYSIQQNFNTQDLLRYGWGLTPGDVELVGGISPDRHGTPNGTHPWILRYKDTSEVDYTGKTLRWYSVAYTPTNPPEYTHRFKVAVKNLRPDTNTIRDLIVTRKVYLTTENTAD